MKFDLEPFLNLIPLVEASDFIFYLFDENESSENEYLVSSFDCQFSSSKAFSSRQNSSGTA